MENNKTLFTAVGVSIGGVALAYLGHNYLVKKDDEKTEMDVVATKTEGSGFMKFIFGSTDDEEAKLNSTELREIKHNIKVGVTGVTSDEVAEGDTIKNNVTAALNTFNGFFRQEAVKAEPPATAE
jgi:hypothetical protein